MNNDKYYELAKYLGLVTDDEGKCSKCESCSDYDKPYDEYRQELKEKDDDILLLVRQLNEATRAYNGAYKALLTKSEEYERLYHRCTEAEDRVKLLQEIIDKLTEKNEEEKKAKTSAS